MVTVGYWQLSLADGLLEGGRSPVEGERKEMRGVCLAAGGRLVVSLVAGWTIKLGEKGCTSTEEESGKRDEQENRGGNQDLQGKMAELAGGAPTLQIHQRDSDSTHLGRSHWQLQEILV